MADLGYAAIWLSLLAALYTTVTSLLSTRRDNNQALKESARNAVLFGAATTTLAVFSLLYLLLRRDFSIRYVFEHVSSHLPLGYTLAALWAGQEGSLLFWLWLLAIFAVVAMTRVRREERAYNGYALATISFTQAFLALVLAVASNPFQVSPMVPPDGRGMNPLLRNFWMTVHPPVIFAAYAAYTVPFALLIAGLATNRLDGAWLRAVRRWALISWLLLGAGIAMGAWWAYLELGWGGYWGWDPVENSSLIPWLLGTALLHSMMAQQRRSIFRLWNVWLIFLTFTLCIYASFVTRSGIIQSVHAFGRSSIGYYFLAFIAVCFILFLYLLRGCQKGGAEQDMGSLLSREAGLLYTNLLLGGAGLVVFVGTLMPALVELLQKRQMALGASFYEQTVGPLAQAIVLWMGVCPWLGWGATSRANARRLLPGLSAALILDVALAIMGIHEVAALISFGAGVFVVVSLTTVLVDDTLARHGRTGESSLRSLWRALSAGRRRYCAHLVHLGIALIAVGVTGSSLYESEVQTNMARGQSVSFGGYDLVYRDLLRRPMPDHETFVAIVQVNRGGRELATLEPAKAFYPGIEQWVTEVAIRTTPRHDLYVILAGFEADGTASFRLLLNPLVVWLWVGAAALLLGGLGAWWPSSHRSDSR
ncbi:MAG: heme lyase CcmF/NrfE family subunit [Chloroflexi bacterium]|nr:heme lyase CcmF/NrfE family subunit [Chloroflexota bacterium]